MINIFSYLPKELNSTGLKYSMKNFNTSIKLLKPNRLGGNYAITILFFFSLVMFYSIF